MTFTRSQEDRRIEPYWRLLRTCGLFREFDDADLERVLRNARLEAHPAGVDIIREGEPGEELYAIASGAVQVLSTTPNGREVVLNKLETGSYFGEQALIPEGARRRTATVRSHSPVRAARRRTAWAATTATRRARRRTGSSTT